MTSRPNVIWITLDSVRYDHTSLGGYERETTPNLERIAKTDNGMSFDNCIPHGIRTATSVPSILTGVPPSRHGVGISNKTLPPEIQTVAERFSNLGYRTAAVSENAHVSDGTGLDRGFDRMIWVARQNKFRDVPLQSIAKWALTFPKHCGGATLNPSYHNTSKIVNDVVTRWIKDFRKDPPFFIYAHYNGPHWPYTPPARCLDLFTDELDISAEEAREISYQYLGEEHLRPIAEGLELTDTEQGAINAMYDAEIAFIDECIGKVHKRLLSKGLEDTILVVTSDHGELLGEHGFLGHLLYPYEELLNVPLVTHGLPIKTNGIIQHIDLIRTILNQAGGDTTGIQGHDLHNKDREFTVTQGGGYGVEKPLQYLLDYNSDFGQSKYTTETYSALRTDEYKLVYSTEFERLYKISDDDTDVSGKYPDVLQDLRADLEDWLNTVKPMASTGNSSLTKEMEEQLNDLGYIMD